MLRRRWAAAMREWVVEREGCRREVRWNKGRW
jgi:hypothetical protein